MDQLKKYDVIYIQTMTSAHYALVHKVKDNKVHCITLSSKEAYHTLLKVEQCRRFKGSYLTQNYMVIPLESCIDKFVCTWEGRKEADQAFRLIKQFYKTHLL